VITFWNVWQLGKTAFKKTQYKISQDKNDTKVLMWIGKQVVLSLIEKEISKMLRTPVSYSLKYLKSSRKSIIL